MKKVSFIFGTRPEAIKLAPLILALNENPNFNTHVCVTAQRREMLDQVLAVFGVVPDVDLALMEPNQILAGLTSRAIARIDDYLAEYQPDMVIVQGDTTTVFCAAMAAFYRPDAGQEDYGELGMIQSTVGMFGVFAGFGLGLTRQSIMATLCHCESALG